MDEGRGERDYEVIYHRENHPTLTPSDFGRKRGAALKGLIPLGAQSRFGVKLPGNRLTYMLPACTVRY